MVSTDIGPADLPGGFELRRCTAADVDAVAELHTRRTHPFDGEDFTLIARDPSAGPGWAAAVFERTSGRPVSTLTLLDETVRVGEVELPAGQIELVATDEAFEGRGFVRALMGWAGRESIRRGHCVLPMVGIPSFYRQFGYSYAVPIGSWRPLASAPAPVDPTVTVRRSTPADIESLIALHDLAQRCADVSMGHSAACWRWIVERSGSVSLTAERDGVIVGRGRALPPDEGHAAAELVAADDGAARTVLAAIAARHDGLVVLDRPLGLAGRAIEPFLGRVAEPARSMEWYYVRVPDPVALLNRLRPVLQRRLDESSIRPRERVLISSYRSHVVAEITAGAIGRFRAGGAMQAPVSQGGSGVPADRWAPLLFGPHGAAGLERLVPDVLLGRQRSLMEVLFPPVTADLATFYLPY